MAEEGCCVVCGCCLRFCGCARFGKCAHKAENTVNHHCVTRSSVNLIASSGPGGKYKLATRFPVGPLGFVTSSMGLLVQ